MNKRSLIVIVMVVAGLGLMMACGGGGGGSSETVTYNGETTPAVIDTTSAVNTALDVVMGAGDGGPMDMVGGFLSVEDSSAMAMVVDPKRAVDLVKSALNRPQSTELLAESAQPLATMCEPIFASTGSESGNFVWEICADPEDMADGVYFVKMTITYSDYSDFPGEYIDGVMIVQGTFDENANGGEGDLEGTARIIFRDFRSIDPSYPEDVYIDGWADYTEDDIAQTVTMEYNLFAFDYDTDEGQWMSDYTIFVDYGQDQITMDGTLYDFYNGFVTVTTESPVLWTVDMDVNGNLVFVDPNPTGGTVKLTGAEGYWIAITFSPTGYTVQVNHTGDDAADTTLGPYSWVS